MEFRILGPLEVLHDDVAVPVRSPLQCRALAVLLLDAESPVPMHRMIAAMWDDEPPTTARRQVQNTIAALRRLLAAADPIEHAGDGYRLRQHRSDLAAFTTEVAQAKRESDPAATERLLAAALRRWRGPVLGGHGGNLIKSISAGLEERRLDALEARFAALLELGRHGESVDELRTAVVSHPDRQRLTGQLMLALYRCGDRAAALRAFETLRGRLAEELGIDPDRTVRDLHTAILREDPALTLAPDPVPSSMRHDASSAPSLLPGAIPGFTGRESELDRLSALVDDGARLAIVAGSGGVGKTTLALHWARAIAHRFPDGQLYADLHGFDPAGTADRPESVIRRFLEALGIPAERIPDACDARTDLYRSTLANRQVLVILDNAKDAAQVRPLLPGGTGTFTLATSRNRMTGLITTEGADLVQVEALDRQQAKEILERRLGARRVNAEPIAVESIIDMCGGLPLALAVLATRAAVQSEFPLAHFVEQLRGVESGLSAFAEDDPLTDVTTVFSWSIGALSDEAARLFRLLGLHPGPYCTPAAAASLAGRPLSAVRALFAELHGASLISEPLPNEFHIHDLLRAYARELAAEAPAVSAEATARLIDHYLYHGCTAAELIAPRPRVPVAGDPRPGVHCQPIADRSAALAWFAAEYPVLLNLIDQTTDPETAWNLAWVPVTWLNDLGRRSEIIRTQIAALAAAEQLSDVTKQLYSHRIIANQSIFTDNAHVSEKHLQRALQLCEAADVLDRGFVHHHFALFLATVKDDASRALAYERTAFTAFQEAGSEFGQAEALSSIGRLLAHLGVPGRLDEALTSCQEALALLEKLDNLCAQIPVWDNIAFIHHRSGRTAEAFASFGKAIAIARSLNAVMNEAETSVGLGRVHAELGQAAEARAAWERAIEILEPSEPFSAARIRSMINGLSHP
ncbi:AfsR/SARP family transcriptional regulator [Glycomyces algeriensis]|uniref:SARP family transcriptional regulator n=1 Tax=Glycomyces algeriensis TaxID=256037 RepID=A0A9W6GCA5_9ACTN|nr:BTAD domain-containing putative transcriptional regulator [Glycomyces algeriensis]MDA1365730.1 BTAD domain-containing putative transcriptional regulator [Glycomyces algeriensis]MDR7351419.1 DNA-binding SARP family transcriptional activator [Glycomyces algeriensis]GLI44139.1 SARP family transcriptional regulator [Glycomyces algeriensis]